eukprot:5099325-Pyramimonas_sp.AAC.1
MVFCRLGLSGQSSSAAASNVAKTRRALARSCFLARVKSLGPLSPLAMPCVLLWCCGGKFAGRGVGGLVGVGESNSCLGEAAALV